MNSPNSTLTTKPGKWRWYQFQFSIRTLLIVVLLLALSIAGLKWHVDLQILAVEREREAVIAIEATGASIHFASQSKPILCKTPIWLRKFFTEEEYTPVEVVHLNNDRIKQPIDELLLQVKDHFEALTNPERINLTGTNVTDKGLKYLSGMKRLRVITMARTPITDAGLAHLEALTEIEGLGMEQSKVTGPGLIHLSKLKKLKWLEFNHLPISDQHLLHLRGLENIEYLGLMNTAITDQAFVYLAEMKNLQILVLNQIPITNQAVKKICMLPKLESLYLETTAISNEAINDLQRMKQLYELHIEETFIDETGYQLLKLKLPKCSVHWRPYR